MGGEQLPSRLRPIKAALYWPHAGRSAPEVPGWGVCRLCFTPHSNDSPLGIQLMSELNYFHCYQNLSFDGFVIRADALHHSSHC